MKLLLVFLLVATFGVCQSLAQDKIHLKANNEVVESKVLEVLPESIKYKKFSNLEGPTYTVLKSDLFRIIYGNGDIEEYSVNPKKQEETTLLPGSKLFVKYLQTEKEGNVDASDAEDMLKSYLSGKTSFELIDRLDEADFLVELRVIKKLMGDRSAQVKVIHLLSDTIVFESKWTRGTSNAFYGYSSTRHALGVIVKDQLVKKFPGIEN